MPLFCPFLLLDMFGWIFQGLIIPVDIADVNNAADDVGDSCPAKAGGQADGFLEAAHRRAGRVQTAFAAGRRNDA